ncbi:CBS domain-containing protein [Alkalimarinus sediminis]|uniref:CBS domain-containing protein n=1 Tax=Alkalimarinus sediminis TaxID=1632866 RepID=A0A9E8KR31_9ALTE|nr:CBS domain-containing protein [Alkalimarinus sediminis]UZW76534.1 CBS domain-containing protein [Alkalimarinus sediminis]
MTTPAILVSDYMKPVTKHFSPDTSVKEIVKTLVNNHLVGAPVLDENKKLVGFISEKDCLQQMVNDSYYSQDHHVARDIMRQNPLSVSPNDDIFSLAEEMIGRRPKLYPVVENEQVIGIITRADVLRALSNARAEQHKH